MNPLNVLAPMTNLFDMGKSNTDPTSYTSAHGSGPNDGELATEGIDPSQDSLTQFSRSLTNYTGKAGQETYKQGQKDTQSGMDRLQPVLDYFQRLLNGDRSSIASAMQPESDAISQQFGQVRKMFSTTGARGGGTTSTLAASPFEEIRQLTDLISKNRSAAAGEEGKLALGEAGVGSGEAGLGASMLANTNQAILARRGQNYQVDTANRQMGTQGLEALLGALI